MTQTPGPVAGNAPLGVPFPFPTPAQFQPQQLAAVHPGTPAQRFQPRQFAATHPGAPAPSHVAQANAQRRAGQGRGRGRGRNRRGPDTPRNRGQPGETPRTNVAHPPVPPSWRSAQIPPEQLEAIYKVLTMINSRMLVTPKETIIRETPSDW